MVFSSMIFLYGFLPAHLVAYFACRNRTYQDAVLILSSLFFYAWGEPIWISILLFSALIDYCHGLIVEKYRGLWQSKAALISSVVINLSILGFFKYSSFAVQNINSLFGLNLPFREFALPIGISFYTFQTMSYVIDVYRGDVSAQRSPWKLLLFVSLFHQLVAGPIVRYQDVAHDIEHRQITVDNFSQGISRFVLGLSKKVLLANTAGEISELFLQGNIGELPVLGAWFGIALFALQIYYDFSGYSDMAIGLGRMFGFNYKENFNYPYIARSATDFWRRWHISLGSFFRDYVYIPLGGNRRHLIRNLFIVWFLTGLWHGASWNFVIWGLYYGLLIAIERLWLLSSLEKLPRLVSHFYLVLIALVGWVFFYFTDLPDAMQFLRVMFDWAGRPWVDGQLAIQFTSNALFFLAAIIFATPFWRRLPRLVGNWADGYGAQVAGALGRPLVNLLLLLASTIMLVGQTYNPFLYFRF